MRHDCRSMVIENASIVTPGCVMENASIKVVDGIIADVSAGYLNGCDKRIDARGTYVLPGFIDLHSDAIEKEVQPRTSAIFPVNMAILELDKKLAACGITTMYHSVSFVENGADLRNKAVADNIIREVNRLSPKLNVRTRVHTRFDVQSIDAIPYIDSLISEGNVHLFSIMDHTPGQGQFKKITEYTKDYMQKYGLVVSDASSAAPLRMDHVVRLVRQCQALGIPVASHDDDTEEKLNIIEKMGISISEFPVNMEAVASAARRGMHICFGSPNVVRGSSISGNLSARDAILAGFGDILCSDYAPMSLIHAVHVLEESGIPLYDAVNMVSLNPAKAAGISEFTGSLEAGKSADLVIVDPGGEIPKILKTFVEGREAFSTW